MSKGPKKKKRLEVSSYTHEGSKRKNNPPIGLVSTATDKLNGRNRYKHDPHIDPTLSWAGKAEGMSFEVQNVSLHVHERMDPSRIIKSFLKPKEKESYYQPSFFDEPENNPPLATAIDFYKHDQDWTNRLIAGDSLLVMNSLLVKEGMAGKVQMIYIDPPYGIKYNSNFQPFVNNRDVKDGNDADLPAEPEMIQAFRDTWELGIHSYLTYLRDRLLLARELLHESGSVFIQISDENVHHVREICDEVFGKKNFVLLINIQKTGGIPSNLIAPTCDYIVWYSKDKLKIKFHHMFIKRGINDLSLYRYDQLELESGNERILTKKELSGDEQIPENSKRFQLTSLFSDGASLKSESEFEFKGKKYYPPAGKHWTTSIKGLNSLAEKDRIRVMGTILRYKRYLDDFPVTLLTDRWESIQLGSIRIYIVQTSILAIQRCLLMTTDPGDLVLDITCGSGTTAYVAEQWGRRWITCDTSRVAITLTKQRLMTSKFDYYELANREDGIRSGFKYKTVPHITLKSIANNEPPVQEILYDQPFVEKSKVRVTGPFTVEAVPSLRVRPLGADINLAGKGGSNPAQSGETNRETEWRDELKATGIRALGGRIINFSTVEPMPAVGYLHARGEIIEPDGSFKIAFISFGPDYGPLEQRQVEAAVAEARELKEKPHFLVFTAFHFDPEAAKDIDELRWEGVTLLKAQMSVDLLTDDLRKKRSSNQSYWLIGQPDVELKKKDGMYTVKLKGFDYYNPVTGEIESKSGRHIAMWFLDTDYDDRSMMPEQVFFPEADEKRGWTRLAKALKSEVNEEALQKFTGTESLPFKDGKNKKIAVKIVDNRGIESFVIKEL